MLWQVWIHIKIIIEVHIQYELILYVYVQKSIFFYAHHAKCVSLQKWYKNQKSISEEDELPLQEMASSVGLNIPESCSVYVVLLLSLLFVLLDEVLWTVVVTDSDFETGVELGTARETPNWNFASPPSICILLGV